VDVVTAIRRDPVLAEDQKQTLEHIYRTFRAERLDASDDRGSLSNGVPDAGVAESAACTGGC
jgi:hypothetical protein